LLLSAQTRTWLTGVASQVATGMVPMAGFGW
jgi:hypothetical protein